MDANDRANDGWHLFMWFLIGLGASLGYFIMAANDASLFYIWPLLVVIFVSIFRLWTWPGRDGR